MLYHDHPKIALNPHIQGRAHIYRTDFQQRNKQQLSNAPCIIPTSTIWSSTSRYQHLTNKNWTLMCFVTISPHLVPFDKLPNDAHLTTTINHPPVLGLRHGGDNAGVFGQQHEIGKNLLCQGDPQTFPNLRVISRTSDFWWEKGYPG